MIGIILAAGYATRLYPLTKNCAKPLLPIKGKCMIDYTLEKMIEMANLKTIIVITNHHFYEDFCNWSETKKETLQSLNIELKIVNDHTTSDENKLGAIGDIQYVIEQCKIEDDVMIIAGDNLFTYSLKDPADYFIKENCDLVLGKKVDDEDLKRFAVATIDEHRQIIDLEEKPAYPKSNLIVYATYFYKKSTLPLIKTYLEEGNSPDSPGHFPAWLYKRKPVKLYEFDGICIDIGTKESYKKVCDEWSK